MENTMAESAANFLTIADFESELKKLLSRVSSEEIAQASEGMIKIAIEARESVDGAGGFEFEFESDPTYTSVAKRKKLHKLEKIRETIRALVPPDGLAIGEKVLLPFGSEFEGFTEANVQYVDAFLYPTEDVVDEACDEGVLSRYYCAKCGSKETKELNFLSHSMSDLQADFIFAHVLTEDLTDKCIVDVGSRIGVLLYYSWLFTGASTIIGVEFNNFFCELQKNVVKKFKMGRRVNLQVICADIRHEAETLKKADVVVLNNVFEAFEEKEKQKALWQFVLSNLKKGSTLLAIPSLEQSLNDLQGIAPDFTWSQFVVEKPIEIPDSFDDEDDRLELQSIHCYTVL